MSDILNPASTALFIHSDICMYVCVNTILKDGSLVPVRLRHVSSPQLSVLFMMTVDKTWCVCVCACVLLIVVRYIYMLLTITEIKHQSKE
jgi:hypothetical protein